MNSEEFKETLAVDFETLTAVEDILSRKDKKTSEFIEKACEQHNELMKMFSQDKDFSPIDKQQFSTLLAGIISDHYYLDDKTPVQCQSFADLCKSMVQTTSNDKFVELTKINDDIEVSTVFLGLSYRVIDSDTPVLFETLVFAEKYPELDGQRGSYTSWDKAKAGHDKMVEYVRNHLKKSS